MCSHHFVIPKQPAIILPAFSPLPPVLAYSPLVQQLPLLTPSVPALQPPIVIPLLVIFMMDLAIQCAPQQLHSHLPWQLAVKEPPIRLEELPQLAVQRLAGDSVTLAAQGHSLGFMVRYLPFG